MLTRVAEMLGVEFPICAFSHCRDVVAAVTNAGGLGVLGAVPHSPQRLETERTWIEEQTGGKPFGAQTPEMKLAVRLIRGVLVLMLGICLWTSGQAKAAAVEYLMVPSAAMGRDIPVAFLAGGPHAVYLLDGFNAAPDVSNWVTAGNATNTLGGKGISVVAPAGGAYSMYTNWEQDGSKQWETFLSTELPDWLAANKGLAPGGHGVVGVSQGGYAAAALVTFHPDRFRYAGSLSGFLTPERAGVDGTITAALR